MFIAGSYSSVAQRGYTDFRTEDGVKVMYSWQKASILKKDSDATLNLRVTNENEYPVKWTFTVAFYNDKMAVHESEPTEVCLKPGQSLRGGLAGLRFSVEGLKMEDVSSEHFEWDIEIFDVEQVEACE
jgi:hypothetical protein